MPEDDREILHRFLDNLFRDRMRVSRLDVIMWAQALDLDEDLAGLFELLPPGPYVRHRLANQLNSTIVGHGLSRRYGTVE